MQEAGPRGLRAPAMVHAAAAGGSAAVVKRPRPTLRLERARSAGTPRPSRTGEGSVEPLEQADPEETARVVNPASRRCEGTPATLKFRLPGSRRLGHPLSVTPSRTVEIRRHSSSRRADSRAPSSTMPSAARRQASPKPAMAGTSSVPARRPPSCPPPNCRGRRTTRGSRRRTNRAPAPLGPWILWEDRVSRAMPMAWTSRGIRPAAWAASVMSMTPRSLHSLPNSASGWMVPISFWAAITATSRESAARASSTAPHSRTPPESGLTRATRQPRRSISATGPATASCSKAEVTT